MSGEQAVTSPGHRLRQAWQRETLAVPGVWSALVARMAERQGFHAVYLSGAALSAGMALPDVGLVTLPEFVDAARTDARGVTGFDDAVRRARLYLDAGAEAIFPEAMESADEVAAFARAVPAPLLANMTEFGRSPNLDFADLAKMGYRLV